MKDVSWIVNGNLDTDKMIIELIFTIMADFLLLMSS